MGDEVELVREASDAEILAVLSAGYGRTFEPEWLDWKHRDSPWGPSSVMCARDSTGLLGIVFLMPWPLDIDGHRVVAGRLVDGATAPTSTRRGVFRTLVSELMVRGFDERPRVVFATATPAAQSAHVKNGATALDPIPWTIAPLRPRSAAVMSGLAVLDEHAESSPRPGVAATSWSIEALRWRLDPRSGHRYEVARLEQADGPHGVVFRASRRRGITTLDVLTSWGDPDECAAAVAAIASRERAVAVRAAAGAGTSAGRSTWSLERGASLLCVWDRRANADVDLASLAAWRLSGLDLEGAI